MRHAGPGWRILARFPVNASGGDWKSIREQVARQYGASGKSDDELFVAVSMHNQVRLSRRDALFELYQERV